MKSAARPVRAPSSFLPTGGRLHIRTATNERLLSLRSCESWRLRHTQETTFISNARDFFKCTIKATLATPSHDTGTVAVGGQSSYMDKINQWFPATDKLTDKMFDRTQPQRFVLHKK